MMIRFKLASGESIPEEIYTPEKSLAFFVIERAVADILGARTEQHVRRQAKHWLFARNERPNSAQWWASLADIESVLELMREQTKKMLRFRKYARFGKRKGDVCY